MGRAGSDLALETADAVVVLAGHLPLPLGVAGHEGSTIIVGLNGLRLLADTAWKRARPQTGPWSYTAENSR